MTAMLSNWKELCEVGDLVLGETLVATGAEESADVCMDNPAVARGGCAHGAACGCF